MASKPFVFDKAAWHLDEVRRRGLAESQAAVHIGHAFAWLVEQGLVQPWLVAAEPSRFEAFEHGHLTGRGLLAALGGALADDMLTDEGLGFATHYLDPRTGAFLDDYRARIVAGRDSDYHVPDDEPSRRAVAAMLQEAFDAWRPSWDGVRPDPWSIQGVDEPPTLPDRLVSVPVLPVGKGAPLPGGALSARLRSPSAVGVAREALRGDLLLILLPNDAEDVGVVGWIEECREEEGDAFLVGLRCLARCARDPEGGWRVHRDGAPTGATAVARVRELALAAVAGRRQRGEPLGLLALVPALDGGPLLDLVARALPLDDQEQLVVLESFDLQLRAQQLVASLRTHEGVG